MAISKDTWNKAKAYFEAGKSLAFISEKTGIGRSSISEKAKKDEWQKHKTEQLKDDIVAIEVQNRTIKEKKRTVSEQLATLADYEVEILSELVESEAHIKSLLLSTTALNIIRVNEDLKLNMKSEKINVGGGIQQLEPVKLSSADYKNHQDTLDKASITLGINQRHAPKTDVNITQGQQNNNPPEIVGYGVRILDIEAIDIKEED